MSARGKKVKVWVRIRPTANFAQHMIDLQPDGKTVNVHCARDARRGVVNNQILDWSFKLDGIMHNTSQGMVYDRVAANIVTGALNGYNGTLMCYGQTGAGKTFTITGATENYKHRGIIPRALSQLYKEIEDKSDSAITVRISFLEIYNETMIDLLATLPESMAAATQVNPMTVVEDENGVYVRGLSCHMAQNEEEALNLLFEGETNRAIAVHALNKHSSRSHCIFTVYIESRSRVHSDSRYVLSKLNLVDLAGSERLGKTRSEGKIQTEAMYINKSLTFLEQAVIALADRKREHIPFRQTKLTHCLKDSIGGQCNTLLVANIWGEAEQIEETISTLRFATRMMCVISEPVVNLHHDPAVLVNQFQKEITALKQELAMHDTLTNRSQISYEALSEQQRYEIKQQVTQYIEGNMDEIDIVNVRQIQGVYEAFRAISHQIEKEVEEKLRAKYTLVDKTDPAAIAAAQQAGLPVGDDGELVGEPDGSSFGIGQAPAGSKAAMSSVVNARKREVRRGKSRQDKQERTSPAPRALSPSQSTKGQGRTTPVMPSVDKDEKREEAGSPTSSGVKDDKRPPSRPSTPPARPQAFEDFKQGMGSEINRILNENKDILSGKKQSYADLARQINVLKVEIDHSRVKLDSVRDARESQAPMLNEDGDIIISEEEYLEIKRLKDLKAVYRTDFDELKNLKSEVHYCQKLVDQCRQRLIKEFDNWYAENFLSGAPGEPQSSVEAGVGTRAGAFPPQEPEHVLEDEQEKFDRLQKELLMENPESTAYYNAKMRRERRVTYEKAMSQPQPVMRRKPGTPIRSIRHYPPQRMEVQF